MAQNFPLNKSLIKLLLLWIVSLLYYNAIESFLVIDRLGHLVLMRYPLMNLRIAFVVYPMIVCFAFFINETKSKALYYSLLSVSCLAYSYIVVYFNVSQFPIKTWIIILIFICSIIVCVFFNNRIEQI